MNYLIDTNIISEVRKGDQCNRNVAAWYASVDDAEIYLSVLSDVAELGADVFNPFEPS